MGWGVGGQNDTVWTKERLFLICKIRKVRKPHSDRHYQAVACLLGLGYLIILVTHTHKVDVSFNFLKAGKWMTVTTGTAGRATEDRGLRRTSGASLCGQEGPWTAHHPTTHLKHDGR